VCNRAAADPYAHACTRAHAWAPPPCRRVGLDEVRPVHTQHPPVHTALSAFTR